MVSCGRKRLVGGSRGEFHRAPQHDVEGNGKTLPVISQSLGNAGVRRCVVSTAAEPRSRVSRWDHNYAKAQRDIDEALGRQNVTHHDFDLYSCDRFPG